MDVKALEHALAYAKGAPDKIALVVLKDAVERFLQTPVSNPAPKSEPRNQMSTEESRRIFDMIRNWPKPEQGCPDCGAPAGVPHFCPGKRHNTGIEYWMNQPRAMTNPKVETVLLSGSGDDLTSRGMGVGHGQGFGSSRINLSAAQGRGR